MLSAYVVCDIMLVFCTGVPGFYSAVVCARVGAVSSTALVLLHLADCCWQTMMVCMPYTAELCWSWEWCYGGSMPVRFLLCCELYRFCGSSPCRLHWQADICVCVGLQTTEMTQL